MAQENGSGVEAPLNNGNDNADQNDPWPVVAAIAALAAASPGHVPPPLSAEAPRPPAGPRVDSRPLPHQSTSASAAWRIMKPLTSTWPSTPAEPGTLASYPWLTSSALEGKCDWLLSRLEVSRTPTGYFFGSSANLLPVCESDRPSASNGGHETELFPSNGPPEI